MVAWANGADVAGATSMALSVAKALYVPLKERLPSLESRGVLAATERPR